MMLLKGLIGMRAAPSSTSSSALKCEPTTVPLLHWWQPLSGVGEETQIQLETAIWKKPHDLAHGPRWVGWQGQGPSPCIHRRNEEAQELGDGGVKLQGVEIDLAIKEEFPAFAIAPGTAGEVAKAIH